MKAVLKGKLNHYTKKKKKRSYNNNLSLHLQAPGKEENTNSKISSKQEIIRLKAEINKIENKKQYKGTMQQSWFFESKIDKSKRKRISKSKLLTLLISRASLETVLTIHTPINWKIYMILTNV